MKFGGAKKLLQTTKNFKILIRWETCGLDVAGIVFEFEISIRIEGCPYNGQLIKNNEYNAHLYTNCSKGVNAVCNLFRGKALWGHSIIT